MCVECDISNMLKHDKIDEIVDYPSCQLSIPKVRDPTLSIIMQEVDLLMQSHHNI